MDLDGNDFRTLSREECLKMLASVSLGRVAVCSGALPAVVPITYTLDGEEIVFATARSGQLATATRHAVVAFETDAVDPTGSVIWSVAATGVATEITDPVKAKRALDMTPAPWGGEAVERLARISLDILSGRHAGAGLSAAGDRSDPRAPS